MSIGKPALLASDTAVLLPPRVFLGLSVSCTTNSCQNLETRIEIARHSEILTSEFSHHTEEWNTDLREPEHTALNDVVVWG